MTEYTSKKPTRELTSKSAYIAFFYALPVLIIFAYLGNWQMGIGAAICAALILLVVRSYWDLRMSPWFWLSIGVAILLQVPIVMLVPWGNRSLTGPVFLPLGFADYYLIYGCVKLAEKLENRRDTRS
ncbi:MAG TPA: hypothetical protein VKZ53_27340 [Candidatus Angelobacter sp.]|nr:hypothetical protein [Candidatus Angelobacter sp.]